MTCLAVGAIAISLSGAAFSLHWTHSVEKEEWVERWSVQDQGLRLEEARVKGSGAGMEPGENARLVDGWWVWMPQTNVPFLMLAASGATGGGWKLCDENACWTIGTDPSEAIRIAPCTP